MVKWLIFERLNNGEVSEDEGKEERRGEWTGNGGISFLSSREIRVGRMITSLNDDEMLKVITLRI